MLLIFTPFLLCRKRTACATYQLCILLIAFHATSGRLVYWKKNEVLDSSTSQMYVPGSLNDVENVLVDVGTGYYVEKVNMFRIEWWKLLNILYHGYFVFLSMQNVEDSKAFFKRKIEFLTKQIEKIQPVLQEKHAMKQGKPGYIS